MRGVGRDDDVICEEVGRCDGLGLQPKSDKGHTHTAAQSPPAPARAGHALHGPRHLPGPDHEPTRLPLAHDGGQDDRAAGGQGRAAGCTTHTMPARTSCLHAFEIRDFTENGQQRVEFQIHPKQRDNDYVQTCVADVIDRRVVTDSGGHKEDRWVIETMLSIGKHQWPIEVTLSPRDNMMFRMLIGRTALKNRAMVDSARSYVIGKKKKKSKS